MKKNIEKLLEDLKSAIEHDTYALTRDDINSLSWKIDLLKTEIMKTYEGKRFD